MKILECNQQYSSKRTLFTPMEAISAKTALLDRSRFAGVMSIIFHTPPNRSIDQSRQRIPILILLLEISLDASNFSLAGIYKYCSLVYQVLKFFHQ